MAKIAYELDRFTPSVDATYSGNPLDPAQVSVNKALGRYGAVPPYFIFPRGEVIERVTDPERIRTALTQNGALHAQMPMRMHRRGEGLMEGFRFPLEPWVSVSCRNRITRRSPARAGGQGTVKECWSRDDCEVTISGLLIGADGRYPAEEVQQLLALLGERQAVEVEHELLLALGITALAVERLDLPHTKGLANQQFEIKAYSDHAAELFIPL